VRRAPLNTHNFVIWERIIWLLALGKVADHLVHSGRRKNGGFHGA